MALRVFVGRNDPKSTKQALMMVWQDSKVSPLA
jgi:hypothetical protein